MRGPLLHLDKRVVPKLSPHRKHPLAAHDVITKFVDGAHRLLHAPLAGGLLVTDRALASLTRCHWGWFGEESTFHAGLKDFVWERSCRVGGDHGGGDGVAAVGVLELHVARQAWPVQGVDERDHPLGLRLGYDGREGVLRVPEDGCP